MQVAKVLMLLVVSVTLLSPAKASAAVEVPVPQHVTLRSDTLGVTLSWVAPLDSDVSGYRITASGHEEPINVPADVTSWFIATPETNAPVSVGIATVTSTGSSPEVVAGPARSMAPGGSLVTPPAPVRAFSQKLSAGRTREVELGGIPRKATGVLLTLDGTAGTRPTSVRVWGSPGQPAQAQWVAPAGERRASTFFVPLDGPGGLQLRADRTLTVVGRATAWTLPVAQSDDTGTVHYLLAPQGVGQDTVSKAGTAFDLPDLPDGATAVISSVTVTAARPFQLRSGGAVVAAGGRGRSTTQLVLPVSGSQALLAATGLPEVAVDLLAWVGERGGPQAAASWSIPVSGASRDLVVGSTQQLRVSGRDAVPAMDSVAPPSGAVVEITATAKKPTELVVNRERATSIHVVPGRTTTVSSFSAIDPAGGISLRSSAGKVAVHVRTVGYQVGAVLVQPSTTILRTVVASALGTLDASTGDLSVPEGTDAPDVGSVVVSEATAANPGGLLVRVLSQTDGPSGSTILHTRQAALNEAVRYGAATTAIEFNPTSGEATQPKAQTRAPSRADAGASFSITKPFNREFGGEVASGTLSGDASVTLSASAHLGVGFFSGVDAYARVDFDEKINGQFDANAKVEWNEDIPLGQLHFVWFRFMVGPVPVMVRPGVALDLETDGRIDGEVSVNAHQATHAALGYDLDSGEIHESTEDPPSLEVSEAKASLHAALALHPTLTLDFYTGNNTISAGLRLGVTADWTYPECEVAVHGRLDATLGVSLDLVVKQFSHEFSHTLYDKEFARVPMPLALAASDCRPWTGVMVHSGQFEQNYIPDGPHPNINDRAYDQHGQLTQRWFADSTGYHYSNDLTFGSVSSQNGVCGEGMVTETITREGGHTIDIQRRQMFRWNDEGMLLSGPMAYDLGVRDYRTDYQTPFVTSYHTTSTCHQNYVQQETGSIMPETLAGDMVVPLDQELWEMSPTGDTFSVALQIDDEQACERGVNGNSWCTGQPSCPPSSCGTVQIEGTASLAAQFTRLPDGDGDGIPNRSDTRPDHVDLPVAS